MNSDEDRLRGSLEKILNQRDALIGVVAVEKNRDELISAEARERIFFAHRRLHAMGDGGQEFVADGVSVAVVDGLEVVEVETDNGEDAAAAHGLRHGVMKAVAEEHAIGQSGEQVVPGDSLKCLLVLLLRSDVREEGDVLLRFSGLVADRRDGECLREDAAVLGAIPDFAGPVAAFDEIAPQLA